MGGLLTFAFNLIDILPIYKFVCKLIVNYEIGRLIYKCTASCHHFGFILMNEELSDRTGFQRTIK